jgi:hypothetical protein
MAGAAEGGRLQAQGRGRQSCPGPDAVGLPRELLAVVECTVRRHGHHPFHA